eukprot:scaffold46810_cov58-Phaeocystis_antarctica.AAC.1
MSPCGWSSAHPLASLTSALHTTCPSGNLLLPSPRHRHAFGLRGPRAPHRGRRLRVESPDRSEWLRQQLRRPAGAENLRRRGRVRARAVLALPHPRALPPLAARLCLRLLPQCAARGLWGGAYTRGPHGQHARLARFLLDDGRGWAADGHLANGRPELARGGSQDLRQSAQLRGVCRRLPRDRLLHRRQVRPRLHDWVSRLCSAVADKRAWLLARGRRPSPRHAHAGDWCVLDTVGGLRRRPVLATDWQAQDHLGRSPGGRVQAAGGPLLLLLGRPEVRQLLGLLRVLRRAAVRQRPGDRDAAAAQPADAARVHHRSGAARAVPSRHGHGQPGGGDGCRSLHGGGEPLS